MKEPLVLAAIVLGITVRASTAQEFRGTILGRVTDPLAARGVRRDKPARSRE